MTSILIKNAKIINENSQKISDVLIRGERIEKISEDINVDFKCKIIEAEGLHLFPGLIDDQVHFREPGLTHKADIYTESMAAVAGGVTSYMEMPNTIPNATNIKELEKKYLVGNKKSFANYSFYIGATNNNLDEVLKIDKNKVCGIKIFMGSSTGNMLVDHDEALKNIFKNAETIITTHCEDENTIKNNTILAIEKYGNNIPISEHPIIRSREACYKSSSKAISLAKEYGSKLHVLHISSAEELNLFNNSLDLKNKKITSEACLHHMWFDERDYQTLGSLIKWNPAVKTKNDKNAIIDGLNNNYIDVIATDHAPHTIEEKSKSYLDCPSGGPLIQYSLPLLLEMYHNNSINLETIVTKTSHNPSILFNIKERGFIRENYFADIVLVDLNNSYKVSDQKLFSKCNWSPLKNETFKSKVIHTIVSGNHIYKESKINGSPESMRLEFERD
tara:strand:- start:71 stop:1411 length:1341 start_codon:yes stop_codon:yes gene_type:complete